MNIQRVAPIQPLVATKVTAEWLVVVMVVTCIHSEDDVCEVVLRGVDLVS